MTSPTVDGVRRSMINCSKGDAKRMTVAAHVDPAALDSGHADAVEFLGWHDPKLPGRSYLLTRREGGVVGILMRPAARGARRTAMCALCRTTHTDGHVSLYTAPRAGVAGREGNSVGTYICDDLACPTTVRLERAPSDTVHPEFGRPIEERIAGLRTRVEAFLDAITA